MTSLDGAVSAGGASLGSSDVENNKESVFVPVCFEVLLSKLLSAGIGAGSLLDLAGANSGLDMLGDCCELWELPLGAPLCAVGVATTPVGDCSNPLSTEVLDTLPVLQASTSFASERRRILS